MRPAPGSPHTRERAYANPKACCDKSVSQIVSPRRENVFICHWGAQQEGSVVGRKERCEDETGNGAGTNMLQAEKLSSQVASMFIC